MSDRQTGIRSRLANLVVRDRRLATQTKGQAPHIYWLDRDVEWVEAVALMRGVAAGVAEEEWKFPLQMSVL